jgi:catechol 2,3-dioxygenase-like lactoylglutathione lyase family enzyme
MIQHVTRQIRPAQLDECVRFYGLLGFEPVPVPAPLEGRAVWLGRAGEPGGVQLHLLLDDDARPEQGHVAFIADPYETTLDRLRAAGFEVEPRRAHWGSPRAYSRDPAANLVELMAAAPG